MLRCETLRAASERGAADTLLAARSTRRPRHRIRGKERESEAPPIVGTQPTCGGKASPAGRPGRAGQPTKQGERLTPSDSTRAVHAGFPELRLIVGAKLRGLLVTLHCIY